jgi:PDZ domain-containing protein
MTPLRTRQRRSARTALILVAAVLVAGLVLPVPYVTIKPGPVFDVLAEQDGEPVVEVTGAPTYPTSGRLDMVVVLQEGGTGPLSMGAAAAAWLLPSRTVEPKDMVYPEGIEPDVDRQIDQAVFDASMSTALAAAAEYLGRPVSSEAIVQSVEPGAPADGALQSGDVITAVAGQPTSNSAEVGAAVAAQPAGSAITVDYMRNDAADSVTVTGGSRDAGGGGAYLGILVVDRYTSDFEVDIALDGIGGPSAGLVFALAIVDSMTPEDLFEGTHVAGTGAIDAQGRVGAIGSVDKKALSADDAGAGLFLVPQENCSDLPDRIPEGLTVVPVATLATAIDSMSAWRSGDGELPRCS